MEICPEAVVTDRLAAPNLLPSCRATRNASGCSARFLRPLLTGRVCATGKMRDDELLAARDFKTTALAMPAMTTRQTPPSARLFDIRNIFTPCVGLELGDLLVNR